MTNTDTNWADRYWRAHDAWGQSYAWLTDALTAEFGTPFVMFNSGGGCMLLEATLENGDTVLIGDACESLSPMKWRTGKTEDGVSVETGYGVGVYPRIKYTNAAGEWLGRNKSHAMPSVMTHANRADWVSYPKPVDDNGDWQGEYEQSDCAGWAGDITATTAADVIALVRSAIRDRASGTGPNYDNDGKV